VTVWTIRKAKCFRAVSVAFSHLGFLLRILVKGYGEFVIRGFADPGEPPPFLRHAAMLRAGVRISLRFDPLRPALAWAN
jgi:hypothetical protein